MDNKFKLVVKYKKEFSYLEYHTDALMKMKDDSFSTYYSLIQSILINNGTTENYSDLNLYFEFDNSIFSMSKILVSNVGANEVVSLRIPFLKVNKDILKELDEPKICKMTILVKDNNNSIIYTRDYKFTVLPIFQISQGINDDARLLAKFLSIKKQSAKDVLNTSKFSKVKTNRKFQNYKLTSAKGKNKMLEEIEAIYNSLQEYEIAFENSSKVVLDKKSKDSEDNIYRIVKVPDIVLSERKATKLDLNLLLCACMQEAGYHSILIMMDDDFYAGFFVDKDQTFTNGIEKKIGVVYNYASDPISKIVLLDAVGISKEHKMKFKEALKIPYMTMSMFLGDFFAALDLNSLKSGIFAPISREAKTSKLPPIIEKIEKDNEQLSSIIKTKYIDIVDETEKDRFLFWEKKLLDLSDRNSLVSFNFKLTNSVRVISNKRIDQDIVSKDHIKLLSSYDKMDKSSLQLLEKDFNTYNIKTTDLTGVNLKSGEIFVLGLDSTLRTLIKKSNSAMEETGAPTLYLCLGVLNYKKSRKNERGTAPFMVLPINVAKDKVGLHFHASFDYDDIMVNQTFFEYYKLDHLDFDFEKLYNLGSEFKYMEIVKLFKENNLEDVQLDEKACYIANLTFAHYIMWRDLRDHKAQFKKNKIVQSIIQNKNVLIEPIENVSIEKLENYNNFAAPISYDSTQLRAIMECAKGSSFILDGPPGTGKSQTIVNMIINAFYHGKTVLFVAEKKAALDVVADRLNKVSLSQFCLELHSNKANKTDFFARLGDTMDLSESKVPKNFDKKCEEIIEKKEKILSILNKMHNKNYIYSLVEAIEKYENLKGYKFYVSLDKKYLSSLTDKNLSKVYELIDGYIASANNVSNYANNPLKIVELKEINIIQKNEVIDDFKKLKRKLDEILSISNEMMSILPINFAYTDSNIIEILRILEICFTKDIYTSTLSYFIANDDEDKNIEILNKSNELYLNRKKYSGIFDYNKIQLFEGMSVLEEYEKAEKLSDKIKTSKKCKKALKEVSLKGVKLNKDLYREYFEDIVSYNNLFKEISCSCENLDEILGQKFTDNIDKLPKIKDKYLATKSFVKEIQNLATDNNFMQTLTIFIDIYEEQSKSLKTIYNIFDGKFKSYKKASEELEKKYSFDYSIYSGLDNELGKQFEFVNYVANPDNFSQLVDIVDINRKKVQMKKIGLGLFLDAIILNKFNYKDFREIFEYSLAIGFLKLYFQDEDINYFNPSLFEMDIKKYKNLIEEYNNLVIEMVKAQLTANIHNHKDLSLKAPIGLLKKSISNGGRGVTIRETLKNYDSLIKKHFPCFLMSPMSAAQYLTISESTKNNISKFDIVIFDEASQIPTYEAIGAISRGNSLIVAGDPEQMPPSAYFTAGLEVEDEDIQYDDATSLLDECLSIDMPRIKLSYHYRSRHESLIQFSNDNFYNKNLYTFPSTDIATNRVEFKYVETKERKKNSNISKEEIECILNTFKDIYTNEDTKDKSVGIIVFNVTQQEEVCDAILKMLSSDRSLNEKVIASEKITNEPWFVKSLENVQGDERDIIILSIGFTKNAAGMAIVNGPIVRENGQRRLNVAVSRSKEKMIVVSTLRESDFMNDNLIKNRGQLMLKNFIRYAENNTFKNRIAQCNEEKRIIKYLKNDLEKLGYEVSTNVGNSDFKVDLAILSEDKERYLLGVLLDKDFKNKEITCRDKVYVQDNVLNLLDWKIINIYTLEYYKDKKKTLNKIVKEINVSIKPKTIETVIKSKPKYNSYPYKEYKSSMEILYSSDKGFSDNIKEFLKDFIDFESPVSYSLIEERLKSHSNIKVMSKKAKEFLELELRELKFNITKDQNQDIYWKDGDSSISFFRTGKTRNIDNIPKEEIAEAMSQIVAMKGDSILSNKEKFYKELLKVLKVNVKIERKINDRLEYIYYWAHSQNLLKESENLRIS